MKEKQILKEWKKFSKKWDKEDNLYEQIENFIKKIDLTFEVPEKKLLNETLIWSETFSNLRNKVEKLIGRNFTAKETFRDWSSKTT